MCFFALMFFVRGILPVAEYAYARGDLHLNASIIYELVSYDVVFFLAGYYLEKRVPIAAVSLSQKAILLSSAVLSVLLMALGTQMELSDSGTVSEQFYPGLLLLPAAAVFYLLRGGFAGKSTEGISTKLAYFLGGVSFGVMLLEHLLRKELQPVLLWLNSFLPEFTATLVWILVVYLSGAVITLVFKQIPGLKKLL